MDHIEIVQREIVQLNLKIKELIQEIQNCKGPREILNELNHEGRKKISLLRNNLNLLKALVDEEDLPVKKMLAEEMKVNENELAATVTAFQQANFRALLAIDQGNRRELLDEDKETVVRHREKKDKENLIKMSTNITDQLMSISRNLHNSVQRSTNTLDMLVGTSTTIEGTKAELSTTGDVIGQSGKLLAKYGRREETDKVLVFFAFIFFLVCVLYVIHKRLF